MLRCFVVLAVGACSSQAVTPDASPSGVAAFAASWTCSGTQHATITMPTIDAGPHDNTWTETSMITANPDGTLTMYVAFGSGGTCTKTATLTGPTTASFTGQACSFPDGSKMTYTDAMLTVAGTTMTEAGTGTLSGTITDGTLAGTASFQGTCTRS